ncbi:hypothetical protein Q1695_012173 [Nippostrongylus brasiliensis]|nr:hypothetical protein Q1695_012173 [Nippostrongylus brasiliensis]
MPLGFLKRIKDTNVDLDAIVDIVGPADDSKFRPMENSVGVDVRTVGFGADLYLLPSPCSVGGWEDSIDLLHYFHEEVIRQRP